MFIAPRPLGHAHNGRHDGHRGEAFSETSHGAKSVDPDKRNAVLPFLLGIPVSEGKICDDLKLDRCKRVNRVGVGNGSDEAGKSVWKSSVSNKVRLWMFKGDWLKQTSRQT